VADALSYLHGLKIYHGDLKGVSRRPLALCSKLDSSKANILISQNGRALLSDFGASKLVEDSLSTTINNYAFTLRWVPPERINGGLSATAEGDIYSFGMTALVRPTDS
jgi:serine/threonine protein kinase